MTFPLDFPLSGYPAEIFWHMLMSKCHTMTYYIIFALSPECFKKTFYYSSQNSLTVAVCNDRERLWKFHKVTFLLKGFFMIYVTFAQHKSLSRILFLCQTSLNIKSSKGQKKCFKALDQIQDFLHVRKSFRKRQNLGLSF